MSNTGKNPTEMVAKSRNKVLSCSTPEHHSAISSIDSPSRESDSDAASPVPFLCTQDGAEGETDVVWNFYTPKSGATKYNAKITTPASRRARKSERLKNIEKEEPKRRIVKPSQKKIELFQELIELNHDLNKIIKKNATVEKPQSEEDIFSDGSDSSPRSGLKSKNRCLRKNVLSSKFLKPESESGLESDDSMNEYLLKASQAVEENILNSVQVAAKRPCFEPVDKSFKPSLHVINQDSMDAILNNIKIESPNIGKLKRCETPKLNNDSFDNLLGNLNDSTIENLSQYPVQTDLVITSDRKNVNQSKKDLKINIESPSSKIFSRHSSMPESPSVNNGDKPSTSGMSFSRYSSMPFNKSNEKIGLGDSPIRCTPEEIRKKHQQAREKLLAKRTLPFTPAQQIIPTKPTQTTEKLNPYKFVPKKPFQPKVPTASTVTNKVDTKKITESIKKISADQEIKQLIEKKRQEALMKLRRRHTQKKS